MHCVGGTVYKRMTMDSYDLDAGRPCVPFYDFGAVGPT